MADGHRLGVDFGTSNTLAVLTRPDGRTRPLLFDGSPVLPSTVYADPSGTLLAGRDAAHAARLDPARCEPHPKRRIDDRTVLLGDREFRVAELIAAVLGHVAREVVRVVGRVPAEVTVTYPASWGATRRGLLTHAARLAGLGEVRLVPEPVAAAAYFTSVLGHRVPPGSALAVYDLGGGTFDASVVAAGPDGLSVLAVDGLDDAGGLDIDAAIVEWVGRTYGSRDPDTWARLVRPAHQDDLRARRLLWQDVTATKEALSRTASAAFHVPLLGDDARLTREEFERLAEPMLARTVALTGGVIRASGRQPGQLAGLLLVGGASRVPLVATLLHRGLGVAPTVTEQPEMVVAEGSLVAPTAAVAGAAPAAGTDPAAGAATEPTVALPPLPKVTPPVRAGRRRWYAPLAAAVATAAVLVAFALAGTTGDILGGGAATGGGAGAPPDRAGAPGRASHPAVSPSPRPPDYPPSGWEIAFKDELERAGTFHPGDDAAATCDFPDLYLRIQVRKKRSWYECDGPDTRLGDLALEVTVSTQGACAGIWFHRTASRAYHLKICGGEYTLHEHTGDTGSGPLYSRTLRGADLERGWTRVAVLVSGSACHVYAFNTYTDEGGHIGEFPGLERGTGGITFGIADADAGGLAFFSGVTVWRPGTS